MTPLCEQRERGDVVVGCLLGAAHGLSCISLRNYEEHITSL